jgi:phosphonate transport system ATP-binding protein
MIHLHNVSLGYGATTVLHNLDLRIGRGEFIGIIGRSGAGKSTLLSSIIGNVRVYKGEYRVLDHHLDRIRKKELKDLRCRIGFIFQGYNLVNRLNTLHNIMSGMLKKISLHRSLIKLYSDQELKRAHEYMKVVGIEAVALQRCDALSGGQRQRVAIARALAQEPEILLADEPVAALDPISAGQVMEILKRINRQYGVTIIANLHHLDFARDYCSRIIGIAEGQIVFDDTPQRLNQAAFAAIYKTEESTDDALFPEQKTVLGHIAARKQPVPAMERGQKTAADSAA